MGGTEGAYCPGMATTIPTKRNRFRDLLRGARFYVYDPESRAWYAGTKGGAVTARIRPVGGGGLITVWIDSEMPVRVG